MTTEALIKPANIEERVLGKLTDMKQKNQTAYQMEKIGSLEKTIKKYSYDLAAHYFGISPGQFLSLPDEELKALFFIVAKRAKKTSFYVKIFGYGIPIAGWCVILEDSLTINLTNSIHELKEMIGEEAFDPVNIIRGK